MARFSSGLRNALATDYGLGIMMNGGVMRVYGGVMPESPDLAPATPLLGTITTEGRVFIPNDPNDAGLMLQFIVPGGLMNLGDWRLTGNGSGTATWFRWHWKWADDLGDSTFYPRVDGSVGLLTSTEDLRLNSVSISPDTNRVIDQFLMVLG